MEKHSSISAYLTGLFAPLIGGLTLDKVGIIIGIATSIGTFAINWYYKRKDAQRRERENA